MILSSYKHISQCNVPHDFTCHGLYQLAFLTIILDDQLTGQHVAVQESCYAPQTCKCYIFEMHVNCTKDACNHYINIHYNFMGFSTAPVFTVSNDPLAFTCNSHSDNTPGICMLSNKEELSIT